MAIEQEESKWGPHPPITHSGRDTGGPVAGALSGRRCAVAMTAVNLSFPSHLWIKGQNGARRCACPGATS